MKSSIITRWAAVAAVAAASLIAIPAAPAVAGLDDSGVVINEIYNNGSQNTAAAFKSRFFELYNPTDEAISVDGWSLQYKSSGGAAFSSKTELGSKTIEAGGYLLVSGGAAAGDNGATLPTPDVVGGLNSSGSNGVIALSRSTTLLTGAGALDDPNLVDLVGYGSANLFEGTAAAATGGSPSTSISRDAAHVDTDVNSADFTVADPPSPCASTGCYVPPDVDPPTPAVDKTIAEVQGTGFTSPLVGTNVAVQGVVTATYTSGLYNGAYIQTEGTGDIDLADHTASDGIFVSSLAFATDVQKGDFVEVTGIVSESFGLTQITTPADGWQVINDETHDPVEPATVSFPMDVATRESLEGTLLDVQGELTVTNNYTTDRYGDIGLVDGDEPLDTPTNVVAPGEAANALQAANDARLITLDDGSDVDRFSADKNIDMPWLTLGNEVRVGASATITDPVILDYRRSLWRLQPTERLVAGEEPATFSTTRAASPKDVGGDVKIGTFNVLNYFTTTGEAYDALPGNSCSYYDDRAGNHITNNNCGDGPRGAATDESLQRQQDKIVTAINTLDADVVSLEEIENSINFGPDRDAALSTLVAALNTAAGEQRWAFVPSPSAVPASEDVIRTAFIYQPASVETVGDGEILIGDPAFDNARQPLAQTFKVAGGSDDSTFAVIVNHFKSKGSGSGIDADQNDGQGASNNSRTLQAQALVAFAGTVAADAGTDRVFLTGDFNSYNMEDPIGIIEDAGFINVATKKTDKETYQFDGQVGSLDHVFASEAAFADVTDADIWNINSFESPGREYSRFNYNAVNLYDGTSPFRASDHDPEIVGFDAEPAVQASSTSTSASAPATIRSGEDLPVAVTVSGDETTPTGDVVVTEGDAEVGRATLSGGSATVVVEGLAIGSHALTVSYEGDSAHTGSADQVATEVLRATAEFTATAEPGTYGTSTTVQVTGAPGASGLVYAAVGGRLVAMGMLVDGTATLVLPSTLAVGTTQVTVFYAGNGSYDPTSTTTSVTVAKATTWVRAIKVSPTKIVRNRTKPFVTLAVTARGFRVDGGTVTLRRGGTSYTGTVKNGTVRIRLGTFTSSGPAKKVTATYSGSQVANGSSTSFTVKVLKK